MRKLTRFLKGYRTISYIAPLCKLIEAIFELIIPLIVAKIIDVGIPAGDTVYVWKMGGLMLLLGALGLGLSMTCQYLAARASLGFGTNVRSNLYKHINSLSYSELDKIGTSSLITRLTNDINQTQQAVSMFIRLVLRAPFIAIGAIVMALIIDVNLASIFIVMAIAVSIVLWFAMSRSMPYYRKIQNKLDDITLLTHENLAGCRVVRAFSKQDEERKDFEKETSELSKIHITVGKIEGLLNPLTYALINFAIMAILWFGGGTVNTGKLMQGDIIALVNYSSQILLALVVIAQVIPTFTKASSSAARINEVFALKSSISDDDVQDTPVTDPQYKISFNNVSFCYGENTGLSLQNINLTVKKGETLGIIGATGSGKTTFVNLIPRYYNAQYGEICIDDTNIKNYALANLRHKIGIVPQSATLFSGTIRENLQWGKENATDEEIWEALNTSQSSDFVKNLPNGLDTLVLQGGKNLSGGQKQRLTIARALINNPEILILDDSSSALDYATDAKLRSSLKLNTSNMTVIQVSQRASSIKYADQILVLDEGVQVGLGCHEHLLNTCDIYKEICLSQLSKEELKR